MRQEESELGMSRERGNVAMPWEERFLDCGVRKRVHLGYSSLFPVQLMFPMIGRHTRWCVIIPQMEN